jgi:parvulin-like peptidyl-prolyl isomerase
MLSRLRPSTRRRFSLADEDRRTFLVNLAFAGVIVGLVVLLVGVAAWTYYVQNLRPVASVAGVEIPPGMVTDRFELAELRITREEARLRQAVTDNEIDPTTAQQRSQQLQAELDELQASAEESLIDLLFQEHLARDRGITVTPADIDARLAEELAGVERRRVQMIIVEPDAADPDAPTYGEREAARLRAEEALRELNSGASFAEVAREYSTDQVTAPDGELGVISSSNPLDDTFRGDLFDLEQGETTDVIRGADGAYRIGRVTEIMPGGEERRFLDDVLERMSMERYRQFLAWEISADRLRDNLAEELLGGAVEQLRLSHIRIDTTAEASDEEDEGEVHYSEILVAPNDEPDDAPELPEDDPAWAAAEQEAQEIFDELNAIIDIGQRQERFRALAREKSDSLITGEDGGDAGFVGRDLLPEEVGNALFDEELEADQLLGPVRDENGFYVLWFHERREPAAKRLADLKAALEQPDPDWSELVAEYSDDDQSRDEDGDIGWWTRAMLDQVDADLADKLFVLSGGDISPAIELGNSTHVFLIAEDTQRELDADQRWFLRNDAFEMWYGDRKEEAEDSGVIRRADEEDEPGVDDFSDEELDTP